MRYSQHESKPKNLFEKNGPDMSSIYDKICAKMKRNAGQNNDAFSQYDFYIYLQPTDQDKIQEDSFYSNTQPVSSISSLDSQPEKQKTLPPALLLQSLERINKTSLKRKASSTPASPTINSPSSTSLQK